MAFELAMLKSKNEALTAHAQAKALSETVDAPNNTPKKPEDSKYPIGSWGWACEYAIAHQGTVMRRGRGVGSEGFCVDGEGCLVFPSGEDFVVDIHDISSTSWGVEEEEE